MTTDDSVISSVTPKENYILHTGSTAAPRLHLLHQLFGPISRQMLLDAGIAPGKHVLDLGCGIGDVTCWIASQVGPNGSVVAIDLSPDQLDVSRQQASQLGVENVISFLQRNASDTGLPSDSFDIVFCRFLLCHLTDPFAALKEMHRVLKPGGAIVCQDVDLATVYSLPHSDAVHRSVQAAIETGRRLGADYLFGRRLHTALLDLGFTSVTPRFDQPIHLNGPEKRFWEYCASEASEVIVKTGTLTREEMDELCREVSRLSLDPRTVIAQHGSFSCRAVKPA
jgi:ubiquinone/menaquinone biosynthesis C-methylase UbiE